MRPWRFRQRQSGHELIVPLSVYWEVEGDPITDDFTTDDTTADELLRMWADDHPREATDLVPIYWFIQSREGAVFEGMPFQYEHDPTLPPRENFLQFYSWPVDAVTGRPLNFLTLPVIDKLWRPGNSIKGGFLQEATGWKPSILQPFVTLTSLLRAIDPAGL